MAITLLDSKEILPTIKNGSYHAIITDPPYNLSEEEKLWYQAQFKRLCHLAIIVFCPPKNQWILPADQYLFWIKPISTKNTSRNYSNFVEMILVYGKNVWNTNRHWSQYTNVFMDLVDNSDIHEHRKPPSLIERLILNHTNVGDYILDPFAGSGVVNEVGTRLGRFVDSYEINDKYFEHLKNMK